MNDAQAWQIRQLEKQVEKLQDEVESLRSLRDQLLGMSAAAKWGLRLLIILGGTGAVDIVTRLAQWLNHPVRVH